MKNSLLALSFLAIANFTNAQCNQLFYSEYVEGTSHNKAVEIYNPTANPISLADYKIVRYSNGNISVSDYYDALTGTIAPYDAYVVTNGVVSDPGDGAWCDAVLYAMGDEHTQPAYPSPLHMNGNDAITLELESTGAILDIIGKIGEDPGTAWADGNGAWWTKDHSLIRKSSITGGVTTNPITFDPSVQWDSLPENTWTNLGMHTCDCSSLGVTESNETETFYLFPNPASGESVLLKGTEVISTIEVFNTIGEMVMTLPGTPGRADYYLSVENLESGIYFIHITFSNQLSSTQKLIKK